MFLGMFVVYVCFLEQFCESERFIYQFLCAPLGLNDSCVHE